MQATVALPVALATTSFNGRESNGSNGAAKVATELPGTAAPNKPRQRRRTSIINEPKEPPIREQ